MKKIEFVDIKMMFSFITGMCILATCILRKTFSGIPLILSILSIFFLFLMFIIIILQKSIVIISKEKIKFEISDDTYNLIINNRIGMQKIITRNINNSVIEYIELYIPSKIVDYHNNSDNNRILNTYKYKLDKERLNIFVRLFIKCDYIYLLDSIY